MTTILFDSNLVQSNPQVSIVLPVGGLNVSVARFPYLIGGATGSYGGNPSLALTDNATNYVYLDSGGTLQVSTTGYPPYDVTTKIARVTTGGGAVGAIIADRTVGTFGGSGSTTVDFGAFPGGPSASVAVTGQSTISATSQPRASVRAADSADHLADEHVVEPIRLTCGNIVPGTGFTIYAVADSPHSFLYGVWNVDWSWN
jgi:hypothetical protein